MTPTVTKPMTTNVTVPPLPRNHPLFAGRSFIPTHAASLGRVIHLPENFGWSKSSLNLTSEEGRLSTWTGQQEGGTRNPPHTDELRFTDVPRCDAPQRKLLHRMRYLPLLLSLLHRTPFALTERVLTQGRRGAAASAKQPWGGVQRVSAAAGRYLMAPSSAPGDSPVPPFLDYPPAPAT
jgi:hypothetical protein